MRERVPVPARFRVRDAMRLMRKHDPQLREDGFHLLKPHAAEHVEELIGEARSETARPLMAELLHDESESIRDWAWRGLELLAGKKSRG